MDIRNIKIISLVFVCLLSLSFVFALGISSPYWKEYPLEMYSGETRDVEFSLVNRPDAETAEALVTMIDDAGIAEIISGTKYTVRPGTSDSKIVFKVTIPEGLDIGKTYNIKFSVGSAPEEGEGAVQIAIKYNVDFPVVVVGKPPTPPTAVIPPQIIKEVPVKVLPVGWIIAVIALVIVLIYFVLKKREKQSS